MMEREYAVGLDIGGTKIAAGIVSFPAGEVLRAQVIPTRPDRGGAAVLADCLNLARDLLCQSHVMSVKPLGIGVGICELVDLAGNVTSAHTIAWRDIGAQQRFNQLAPAVVESDVRAAALAEALFGAGRGSALFVYVTVGTGISHCLVQDSVPFTGARGNALIMASSPLSTTCTRCGARLHPILDDISAGPALVARYNAMSEAGLQTGEQVIVAAAAGDPIAGQVVHSAGQALGNSIAFLINVLDPEQVIIGGGLGLAGGLYWHSCVAAARWHIWSDTNRDIPIRPAALGNQAGLIGAAATVWRRRASITQTAQPISR